MLLRNVTQQENSLKNLTARTGRRTKIYSVCAIFAALLTLIFNGYSFVQEKRVKELEYNTQVLQDGSDYLMDQVRLYATTGDIRYFNYYWAEV